MKTKYILSSILILILADSCIIETKGKFTSLINNLTSQRIEFKFYKSGNLVMIDNRTDINPYSSTNVLTTPGDDLSTYYERIAGYDSLEIHYDSLAKSTHYGNSTGTNPGALNFSNNRNIFNKLNWEERVIENKKKRKVSEFIFTITIQDYLNAQK